MWSCWFEPEVASFQLWWAREWNFEVFHFSLKRIIRIFHFDWTRIAKICWYQLFVAMHLFIIKIIMISEFFQKLNPLRLFKVPFSWCFVDWKFQQFRSVVFDSEIKGFKSEGTYSFILYNSSMQNFYSRLHSKSLFSSLLVTRYHPPTLNFTTTKLQKNEKSCFRYLKSSSSNQRDSLVSTYRAECWMISFQSIFKQHTTVFS